MEVLYLILVKPLPTDEGSAPIELPNIVYCDRVFVLQMDLWMEAVGLSLIGLSIKFYETRYWRDVRMELLK